MNQSSINEMMFYNEIGTLYPYDLRHDPANRAFCDLRPDGSLLLWLHTEPIWTEANLIFNDGFAQAIPMQLWGQTQRWQFWQVAIHPARSQLSYAFALKQAHGQVAYMGRYGCTNAVESPFLLDLQQIIPVRPPHWIHGAMMYQIFPERFANGDPSNDPPGTVAWGSNPERHHFQGGDLAGITAHLDYLQDLGVEVIYLNPIMPSPSNHKYDTTDYYHVDAAFGGDEALHKLVAEAHRRGIRLILDASFNHCFPQFFAFQDVLKNGPQSPYWNWFTVYEFPLKVRVRSQNVPADWGDRVNEVRAWLDHFSQTSGVPVEFVEDEQGRTIEPTYEAWFGVINMPKLNQNHPDTRAYFLDVATYWIREFGIDGWRMDVAQHVVPDFWRDFRQVVRAVKPDAYLIAEVWGDCSFWLQGDMFDATMNYTFRHLCLYYFALEQMDTRAFADGVQQWLRMYADGVNGVNQNLLSSHDAPRFRHLTGEREERFGLATLFQMTVPGVVGIYYGDEVGLTGGHDPDCRRAFPWGAEESWNKESLALVRELAGLRRRSAALRYGDWRLVWVGEEALAYVRTHERERVLVVLTRQQGVGSLILGVEFSELQILWGVGEVVGVEGGVQVMAVPAHSGLIIQL